MELVTDEHDPDPCSFRHLKNTDIGVPIFPTDA